MPLIETPPESPRDSSPEVSRVEERQSRRGGRYGDLDHSDLVHLLDEVDDERARARFREAIYISLIVWLVIGWVGIFGVRYLPHPPRIQVPREHGNPSDREMTYLETPRDLPRTARSAPRTPPPSPKVAEQAPAMRAPRAERQPTPAPRQNLPATPQPQAATAPPPPRTSTPTPQPAPPKATQQATVNAPTPAPTRPNFGQAGGQTAGDAVRRAAQQAAQGAGLSGVTGGGGGGPVTRQNLNTGVDVLSDMQGVNFNPYLRAILKQIYDQWIPLIPEEARPPLNKQGDTSIRFMIMPDGRIGMMHLDGSSHDDALNRAAWGSITGVGAFPPLPKEFHGPNLELRIHYLVNEKPE